MKIQVDMSTAHDSGIFDPKSGDKISIAGNFNDWEPESQNLTDENGDWIFETSLSQTDFEDVAEFKFVILSGGQLDLPNNGWEIIPNRQISLQNLAEEKPTLTYNKPWSPLVTEEISITVNMSNQKVLGFFNPEKGDRIVVSGSFNNWDENGIVLDRIDTTLVYELTFPVQKRKHEALSYKYRILEAEGNIDSENSLNEGWEFIQERTYNKDRTIDFFNNQKRILRIVADETWLTNKTEIQGYDELYATLFWNDKQQNYPMKKTENGYEVSVQVPEYTKSIQVELNKNLNKPFFLSSKKQVTLNGHKLILKSNGI